VTLGTSLVLAAIGAVLKWAVTAHINGFDIQTAGLVVFIVGLAGVLLSLLYMLWWTERDHRAVRDPRYPQQPPPYNY
jgi:hypothetical protein